MRIKNITEFDEDNFKQAFREYSTYRKSYGLLTANMCSLPIVKLGFIVSGVFEESVIPYLKEKYGDTIMCRTDASFNAWQSIPRGRDINIEILQNHYNEMLSYAPMQIILLCFQHPSVYFTGKFVERWNISGGVNILIIWGEQIIIEYVGKGFDVGDLTRGVNSAHQRFIIPWTIRCKDHMTIWESMNVECINKDDYILSRELRLNAMQKMGYDKKILDSNIPKIFTLIQFNLFSDLYSRCIRPVLNKKNLFIGEKPITILVNVYDNAFHVFEIWESNN